MPYKYGKIAIEEAWQLPERNSVSGEIDTKSPMKPRIMLRLDRKNSSEIT
jgi:hypothetical protein